MRESINFFLLKNLGILQGQSVICVLTMDYTFIFFPLLIVHGQSVEPLIIQTEDSADIIAYLTRYIYLPWMIPHSF